MGSQVGGGQEGEDEETRQAKEQAAARRRWEALVIGEFPSRCRVHLLGARLRAGIARG
jgi:hypothetical protein